MIGPSLKVEKVTCRYNSHQPPVLNNISIEIPGGAFALLIGPNGSGKTTFLRCCADLIPYSGRIYIDSQSIQNNRITDFPKNRNKIKRIVYIPQGHRVFPRLTVRENLLVGGHTLFSEEIKLRIAAVLELFPRLQPLLNRTAGLISGGEQQETVLARALMVDPDLLLIDEPFLGLDQEAIDRIGSLLYKIKVCLKTILVAEHKHNYLYNLATHYVSFGAKGLGSVELIYNNVEKGEIFIEKN